MSESCRSCMIVGNWKMHKTIEEALDFSRQLLSSSISFKGLTVGLAVPYTVIFPLAKELKGSSILVGAQNMNDATEGAFTGEIAGRMLTDAGATFVLLGHSERRMIYHESNELINQKVKRAIQVGLQPILCIGETLEEKETEKTFDVIKTQLQEGLKDLQADQLQHLVLAYEPVWAIGSGKNASPEIVQEVHQFCRETLSQLFTKEFGQERFILYGGSVMPSNSKKFLMQSSIDGLLVGGASLSLESFLQIVNDVSII